MEALFIYIIKSSGLIALFYFAYYFLLRKETFFNSSRGFLLAGLITSLLLPFLVYTKIVWVEPTPVPVQTVPVVSASALTQNVNYSHAYVPQTIQSEPFEINWTYVILAIYTLGFLALVIKFVMDFYSLNSVLKGKEVQQQEDFKFIDINENIAPFSYFDYIVYNSSMFTEAELESILEHEKVHSDQHHTIDVLISRIFCVLFWFNPIIWLYKKAILQNLEFIADNEASKKISDKKAYQYTLLKITTHENCVAITNHFYQSLIKKRIVMLNKNQSKKRNYWKYYAVLPALGAFILLFQIKTIAQEKKEKIEKNENEVVATISQDGEVFKIKKTTTDQELKELTAKLKADHNIDVAISEVKRNSNNELTGIKIEINKEDGKKQTFQVQSSKAIKDCSIVINTDNNGGKDVDLITEDQPGAPMMIQKRDMIANTDSDVSPVAPVSPVSPVAPVAPVPPVAPIFPSGALPPAPAVDMSKMPKPPVAPKNPMDKVAMAKFQSEMDEFERKMEKFQPNIDAMEAYGNAIEEIMSKREAIFEKEMEKYQLAMQKFNSNMDKFNIDMKMKFGSDSQEYQNNMKLYEQDMKKYELDMKQHEKDMKQHAKDMKQHEKDMKKFEKDSKKS